MTTGGQALEVRGTRAAGVHTHRGVATVLRKGPRVAVDLPTASASPHATWSAYAYRSGMVGEYLAEGVSRFLQSPSEQARLEDADPDLVPLVEGFLREESAP